MPGPVMWIARLRRLPECGLIVDGMNNTLSRPAVLTCARLALRRSGKGKNAACATVTTPVTSQNCFRSLILALISSG